MMLITHPHLSVEVKKEYGYTSTPPLGLHGLLWEHFYLTCMSMGDKYTVVLQFISFRCLARSIHYLTESSRMNHPVVNHPLYPVKPVSPVIFKFMHSFRPAHFSRGPLKCTRAFYHNFSEFCCQCLSRAPCQCHT